ncbi:MAG TPA: YdjY domain-containing protein [Thermoanaerobaculia bacterium]|jgi:hypothetical protein|nr:YdjY domain-containing protein [Thermoanaerobaculia bacterium]
MAIHAILLFLLSSTGAFAEKGGVIVRRAGEIEFTATVNAKAFESGLIMPGYHAIVWRGGKAAHAALLEAEVTDRQVIEALEALGGKPGDNLPMESWEERKNPKNPAPDLVVAGPAVDILLRLPGRRDPVPLQSVLEDPGGRGLSMRFGGNAANIPKWKSGCIVCLYSCPGSKVGNAKYTVRDYANEVTRFRVRPGVLPPDGTPVRVILRLSPAAAG